LFDKFWEAYPRKVAKADAVTSFRRAKVDEQLLSVILLSLEQFKSSPEWIDRNGKFIPHPSTWLNGKRWNDEIRKAPTWP